MKTYYIPIHFYERDPDDNDLVKLITPDCVEQNELQGLILEAAARWKNGGDSFESGLEYVCIEDISDNIFDTVCEKVKGVWCYCKTLKTLVVGGSNREEKIR